MVLCGRSSMRACAHMKKKQENESMYHTVTVHFSFSKHNQHKTNIIMTTHHDNMDYMYHVRHDGYEHY